MTYNYKPTTTAKVKIWTTLNVGKDMGPYTSLVKALNTTVENIWTAYQETKHTPSPRATLLRSVYPKDFVHKLCSRLFIAVLFITAQNAKEPQCPPIMDKQ